MTCAKGVIYWLCTGLLLLALPAIGFAQALSGLPNPGLTSSYIQIPNASSTGTTLFTLTKLTTVSSLSNAVITATTDTAGVVGVAVNGVGTSGSVLIQTNGLTYCVFNNATTAGDYVTISSSATGDASPVAGNCHDTGFGPPAAPPNGQLVGQVLATNAGAGTYVLRLSLHALSRTIYQGNGGAGQQTATTAFFQPFGATTNSTSETATTQSIVGATGTVENLQCVDSAAPTGAGMSDTYTVITGTFGGTIGGATMTASTVTCAIVNTAKSCSDVTHSVAVTAGQAVEIRDVTASTPAARTIACSFDLVF